MLKVYIVGPKDDLIERMFNSMRDYLVTDNPDSADFLCFQGGADVNPKFYGETQLPRTSINSDRDDEDLNYWNDYPELPKVGICRGGQFLNILSGGAMFQHINNHGGNHEITNLLDIPGSSYEHGSKLIVSSTHHQMMIAGRGGEVLAITKRADIFLSDVDRPDPDFDTEVVWYEGTKCLCFQPHPEYSNSGEAKSYFFSLLKYLIG